MSVTVEIDPNVTALLRAIGLTDSDGRVITAWFDDPIGSVRQILSNPVQRAALFEILDNALPPVATSPPGSRWHPLLETDGRGNVYLTVTGDIVGVAARLETPADFSPRVSAALRLPLVDTAGELRAVAGTADGPFELALDVQLEPPAAVTALRVRATVNVTGESTVAFRLEGVDVGAGPETLEVSTASLGRELTRALQALLRDALTNTSGGDPRVGRTVEHLFGALGLDDVLPPLPIDQIVADPSSVRTWLASIATSATLLPQWFAHLAGLLGADPPAAAAPLEATLVSIGNDVELVLRADATGGELRFGLGLALRGVPARLEAAATLIAIPLTGAAPIRMVPAASVSVRAPGVGMLVDTDPGNPAAALRVGALVGGVRFDGVQVIPEIVALNVAIAGTAHPRIDLTDANAVVGAASAGIRDAIEDALGDTGPAVALLALAGFAPPRSNPGSPHLIDLTTFAMRPTQAIADVHRAVLADPVHGWSHMLGELRSLFGLAAPIAGAGSDSDPWRVEIGSDGALGLDLIAWDARPAGAAAGDHRLRIGLAARATSAPWSARLTSEILGFDLAPPATTPVRLVGRQRLSLALAPVTSGRSAAGITVEASAVRVVAEWSPGEALVCTARIEALRVLADGDAVGPLTLTFPTADTSGGDLGFGASVQDVMALLRLLVRHAIVAWGSEALDAVGELMGLYGPEGWPLLEPPNPNDLGSLFADPAGLLRDHARRVAFGIADNRQPHAVHALALIAGVLRDEAPALTARFVPRLSAAIGGLGTYESPWSVPLVTGERENIELLVWLDPGGPPSTWAPLLAGRIADVVDGPTFAALAPQAAAFVPNLPVWLGTIPFGNALGQLSAWLATSDGAVPLSSQLPNSPGWRHGRLLSSPHASQPRDPDAIAQIADQLHAWQDDDGGRAVLVLAPAFDDHTIWSDLLAVVEPGRSAGAHFDFRVGDDPADVATVASHYTANLRHDAGADPAAVAAQIGSLVDRVRALTGRTRVILVAHSGTGVAARVLAGTRPEIVRGIITLGTPHDGNALAPILDGNLAEAVRAVRTIAGGALAGTYAGAVLDRLDAALDRTAGAFDPDTFAAVPDGTDNTVPGFALGSALGGNLISTMSSALASRISVGAASVTRPAPTHLGIGARVALPFPPAERGAIGVDATLRIDAGRIRLSLGTAEPPRPAQSVTFHISAGRPGGWLVGDAIGPGPRVRSADLRATILPGAGASATVQPTLVLRDVVLGAARRDVALGDSGLAPALDLLFSALGTPAANTPAAVLISIARSLGIAQAGPGGATQVDAAGIVQLAAAPVTTLQARRDAVIGAVAQAIGGALQVPATTLPLAVSLDTLTWTLKFQTTAQFAVAEGVSVVLDGRIDLARLTGALDASLSLGAMRLAYDDAAGTLSLSAPPWLSDFVLSPAPDAATLRDAFVPLVPRLALSAGVSIVLGSLLESPAVVGPIDVILADPGATLSRLSGDDLQRLLRTIARALGVDDAAGLRLPGGFVLSASGRGRIRLSLAGSLSIGGGDTLAPAITLEIDRARNVAIGGGITIDVDLPGTFGRVAIVFSAGTAGVGLGITPQNAATITLLPTFSGFGTLVSAGATRLLPHVLQLIVEELRPAVGPPTGLLQASLAVATGLGIYADDTQGFEEPSRAARLASMLQPGFIESLAGSSGNLAGLVAGIFGPAPLLTLPLGAISRDGDRVVWQGPVLAGATLRAEFGWNAAGVPQLAIEITEFDAGPLVIARARVGFDGDLAFALKLRLDPGGEFAFLAPALVFDVAQGQIAAEILPLDEARRADLSLVITPTPAVTFTEAGGLGLLSQWGVPLVARLVLDGLDGQLDTELWTNGPTATDIVEGAGLVTSGSNPPRVVAIVPPLGEIVLGALQALATGISIDVTDSLTVSIVTANSRTGLRLKGAQAIGSDPIVTILFGEGGTTVDWLDDPNAGVTLWLIGPADPGAVIPITIAPGLQAIGLGATLSRASQPLIEGAFEVGRVGALIFFDLELLDVLHAPALQVSGLGIAGELLDARINVAADDGDSFVKKLLPPELQAPFWMAIEKRDAEDVQLHGGVGSTPGAIELTFPIDADLGFVRIRELFLAAYLAGEVELIAAISGNAELGPIAIAVDRVGLRARFTGSGAQFGFKPPDGFGMSIDTSTLRLGGFLLVDERRGRYVGAIEIAIFEKFSLVAIGIITTKRPDGTPGFALLFLISITFPVPIPLGYNFYFAGAGGLLGINRGVDLDRLRIGLRSGTADSILFPTDIIQRIDVIVRDLEESFPIVEGRFLVGPMALITWSNPALISVKLGVIVEIGSPFRLAILGVLRLALPTPDEAVLDLKVAFLGAIDIPASLISFDASIYDSSIGYDDFKLSLEGDISFRISWGAKPDFVASVGGFHPRYHPEAHLHLPPMRRLSVSLLKDNPRITLSLYFAITTNTAQFGARLELVAKAGGFGIVGDFGFDVLVQFIPFYLKAEVSARLAVTAGDSELLTLSLDFSLEGPTPWIAKGTGRFKVLFVTVAVRFEERLGEEVTTALPEVAVLAKLQSALAADSAWSAELGEGSSTLVHIIPPPAGTLVIDAAGMLTVSQRLLPFATDFTLFGAAKPADATRIDVGALNIGGQAVEMRDVTDAFAPIAFRAMSDAEKLKAAAYEQRPAGVRSRQGEETAADYVLPHPVFYETIVLDKAAAADPEYGTQTPDAAAFATLVTGGAVTRSKQSVARAHRRERGAVLNAGDAVERFAVTSTGDLRPRAANGSVAAPVGIDTTGRPEFAPGILLTRTEAEARRDALAAAGLVVNPQIVSEAQLAA